MASPAITPDQAQQASAANPQNAEAQGSKNGKGGSTQFSYFSVLFYLLVDAMTVRQGTVMTQSKVIHANSQAQNELNKRNEDISFAVLPPGAKNATINRVQDENQQLAAMREDIQNSLITARQEAQVEMTQASTNVNILQQDASEDSKWVSVLNQIFQVIDQIGKG